jgi:hypothetical protein
MTTSNVFIHTPGGLKLPRYALDAVGVLSEANSFKTFISKPDSRLLFMIVRVNEKL